MCQAIRAIKVLDVEAGEDDVARELGQLRAGGAAAAATSDARNRRIACRSLCRPRVVVMVPALINLQQKLQAALNRHVGARQIRGRAYDATRPQNVLVRGAV